MCNNVSTINKCLIGLQRRKLLIVVAWIDGLIVRQIDRLLDRYIDTQINTCRKVYKVSIILVLYVKSVFSSLTDKRHINIS